MLTAIAAGLLACSLTAGTIRVDHRRTRDISPDRTRQQVAIVHEIRENVRRLTQ